MHKDGRSQSLNFLGDEEAAADAASVKRVSSASMISLIDFSADPEPVVTNLPVSDPFARAPATKAAADLFAPAPAAKSFVDPFALAPATTPFSDPFGSIAASLDPYAPPTAVRTVPDPFATGGQANNVFGSTGWATFDFSATLAPPNTYPGSFGGNVASNGRAQYAGAGAGAGTGAGAPWSASKGTGGDEWSAFGAQAAFSTLTPPSAHFQPVSLVLIIHMSVQILVLGKVGQDPCNVKWIV